MTTTTHYRVVEDEENGLALMWSLLWKPETADGFFFGVKMVVALIAMTLLTRVVYRKINEKT